MSRRPNHLRRFLGALTTLLLASTALGAITIAPADATVTATFTNSAAIQGQDYYQAGQNSAPITLSATGTPVGSVYPSTVHIPAVPGKTTYLSVQLDIEHTAPDDIDILLVSPTGKSVVLMSDAGGYSDFSGFFSIDTNSSTPMPDTTALSPYVKYAATNWSGNDAAGDVWPAPAPGVANPNSSLATLNGDSPVGDWQLFVHDDQDQDGGVIDGWNLLVSTDAVPTPVATYPAALPVSGLPGTVTDVDLTLDGVNWPSSADLDVLVVAPDGRKALVLSDVGSVYTMSDATLALDDEASTPLPAASAPTNGSYRPTNLGDGDFFPSPAPDASTAGSSLSVFDGAQPNGTWQLYVVNDDSDASAGSISRGWSLKITTSGTFAPRITSTTPKASATGVLTYANIHAVASKALNAGTVTTKTAYLRRAGSSLHIAAKVSYLTATHTIVINPTQSLKSKTVYVAVVTTYVKDAAGHRLDQYSTKSGLQSKTWTFRTR